MVRCNLDNVTCSIPQTICVSGTRCQQPACYPMPLANIQICPPSTQSIILVASSTRVPNTTAAWTWSPTGNMNIFRFKHTESVLHNGKVLVAGGATTSYDQSSAELYDPSTGNWTITGSMHDARFGHTASVLTNGKVLVTGGASTSPNTNYLNSAELYDPVTGIWTTTGSMNNARYEHTASVLTNRKVLVTGGYS
ncbi:unnamed protein product [Rotaria sp. Silwood1]|nr:unnamed protein product [Rotaria sp. Silwood1]